MKVRIDFQLNNKFGVVERLIFKLVLNGFTNAREINMSLPIFSDSVMANALRHLVNEQILFADVETGALMLSEPIIAIIAVCRDRIFELCIPSSLENMLMQNGILADNRMRETMDLKKSILQELLPHVKLDLLQYSLDFTILPYNRGVEND